MTISLCVLNLNNGQVVIEPMEQISKEEQNTVTDNINELLEEGQDTTAEIIAEKSYTFNEEFSCYEAASEVCILI